MAHTLVSGNERKILFQSEFFEVVAINWSKTLHSHSHSHGWSQCFVSVEAGIFENTLDFGNKREHSIFEAGQAFSTPLGAKHELKCVSPTGRTLHVYTPKVSELPESGRFSSSATAETLEYLQLGAATRFDELKKILNSIRDHSISTYSPYFMNQLFSGVTSQMILADEFLSQTRTTVATFEASPVFSAVESEVVECLGELIGWPKGERDGVGVPGGSAANFMAIHCARQKRFPDMKRKGLSNQNLRVYVSSEAHYSMKKACAILGLGTDNLVTIGVDAEGRMSPRLLEAAIEKDLSDNKTPLLVTATAGTTVLGAFDDLAELSKLSKNYGLWLHIDAAWGGPALFSKRLKTHFNGSDLADSMTFDAHKLFGANLTSSFYLTRHRDLLLEANEVSGADYLFHSDDPALDRGKLSWQCGRKAEAFSFWTTWKSVGTSGLGDFVDRLVQLRDQTVEWIRTQERLELVATPQFLNLCVRVRPDDKTKSAKDWSRHVRESMKESNLALVNYSTDDKGSFLRLILAHPHLEFRHLKQILEWSLAVK